MSPTIGYAVLPIIPSLKGAQSAINQQLGTVMPAAGARAGDALGSGMKSSLSRHARELAGVISTGILATGAAVAAGSVAIGKLGISLASQQEQAEVSFSAILGDGEAAQEMLADLADFAATTPFDLPGLRDSASRLLAVGIEAERVIPIMETLGDATAGMGTGAEGIQRAVRALAQMEQKGKVTAEEMLQLAEAGVPAWEALAEVMGVTVPEAQKAVTNGSVQVEQVFQALEQKAGPTLERLTGLMDKQSMTLEGLWSTWKDQTGQELAEAFRPTVEELKDMLPLLTDASSELISRFAPAIASAAGAIADFLPGFVDGLDSGLDLLVEYAPALAGIAGAILGLGKTQIPFIGALIPGGPLALGLAGLISATPEARDAIADLVAEVGPLVSELVSELAPILGDVAEIAGTVLPPAIGLTADALGIVLNIAIPLAGALADLTGFLAEHEGIVLAVAAAYGLWKVQAAGVVAFEGISKGLAAVSGFAAKIAVPTAAIEGLGSAAGGAAGGVGRLTSAFRGSVSGGAAFGGMLAGVVAGATAASYALDKLHESGSRDANEFIAGLGEIDLSSAQAAADYMVSIGDRVTELQRKQQSGGSNFFDDEKLAAEQAALREYADELSTTVTRNIRSMADWQRETGLTQQQVEGLIAAVGQDLTNAFDESGEPSKELQAELGRLAAQAEVTGQDLQSIEMTPEQVAKLEEDAKRMQEAMDAAGESVRAFGDILTMQAPEDGPITSEGIREFYEEQLEVVRQFQADIRTAIEAGYDPQLISRLLQAGPEQAAPVLEALVSDTSSSFVEMVNAGERELADLSAQAVEMARLTEIAVSNHSESGQRMVKDLATAQAISLAMLRNDGTATIEALAFIAGVSVSEFRRIAGAFNLDISNLKSNAINAANEVKQALGSILVASGLGSSGQVFGGGGVQGGRASGGEVWPGTWLVGEQGPELLTVGSPGYVIDATETARLLAGSKERGKSGGSASAGQSFRRRVDQVVMASTQDERQQERWLMKKLER